MAAANDLLFVWYEHLTRDVKAAVASCTDVVGWTTQPFDAVNGPLDVPGGGRIAQLMDPQGAAFALHQAPATSR